ncbi:carotenoid oxygenase family protein [Ralstonia insidiosa]|jgi:all-trans-8'-apo-beta-carotenal 15,15'-oxygenase|nr:carotenoid oxygenase family protein [Ralstonia insidiosa]KMW46867.1 carotenoid oxygenase [Ralstonia sp. MD27]MBX3771140.1 carotenoid oxygenase family protein [Ralstonia pickettii]NOZ16076.1 carotenoid oxygenase [Betaproteobacteria bacterium]MBA9855614.1 carotenoid oxygenase [Ralstonia insidiosa]MBA9869962.1 carotenoid oxygenase [Ralstonia insidiosa]
MQRRSFVGAALAALGAAPFGLTLQDVMAASIDPWAAGFAAARTQYPWLAGYQGASTDMPTSALKVEGTFPPALRGAFYRNGPARHEIGGVRYHHLFDGDGMIQRYDISEQGVTHRGVFVRTDKFVADTAAGKPLRATFGTANPDMEPVTTPDSINVANTSLVMHGDEMLALWEGGSATRVDPDSLRTLGVQTWRDDYKGMPFSAHPKVEPDGTLWNFGVSSAAGLLTVYCVGADGALKRVQSVKVPDVAMVHDFAVTQHHLVFLLPSFVYDVERSREGMSFLDAHVWRPELGMRALVLDKNDVTRMRWLQLPAGFVFHLGNAWSSPDGQEIHLDYVRSDDATIVTTTLRELMRGQIRPAPGARLTQLHLNLRTGRAEQVITEHVAEFPKVDARRTALRHRALFTVAHTAPSGNAQALHGFDTVMRFDTDSGQVQQYRFGHRVMVEEHVFVPASANAREGEGWLIGTVFDVDAGCTKLTAFDARNVSAGPVAVASLNGVAPLGLHGLFRAV